MHSRSAPTVTKAFAAQGLADLFQPGDYALRARSSERLAVGGGYLRVYIARLGEWIDLYRARRDVTGQVAMALQLPLHRYGLIVQDMDLIQKLILAVPAIDTVGLAIVEKDRIYYALPDLPRYEIWANGQVVKYIRLKV